MGSYTYLSTPKATTRELLCPHVLFVRGPESRVIEATNVWPVEVIEKHRVDNLLD